MVLGGKRVAKRAEVGRGADSVQNRKAVGQNRRAECAQQQVFHRAFVRTPIAPQEARQHVEAEGHRFQAQEFNDQVVARGHEHHADGGKQDQRVIFAVIFVLDLQIAHGKDDHQRRGNQENKTEKQKERVHQQRTAESDRPALGHQAQLPQADAAEDHAEHGHQRVEIFVARLQQVIGEQDAHGKKDEHHLRQKQSAAALLHERSERVKDMAHRLDYFFSDPAAGAACVPAGMLIPGIFIPGMSITPLPTAGAGESAGVDAGVAARSAP